MTSSVYYVDPARNSVELHSDTFGDDWGGSIGLVGSSPQFAVHPIDVNNNPALMAVASQGQADATELHRRADAGDFEPDSRLDLRLADGAQDPS